MQNYVRNAWEKYGFQRVMMIEIVYFSLRFHHGKTWRLFLRVFHVEMAKKPKSDGESDTRLRFDRGILELTGYGDGGGEFPIVKKKRV